MSSRTWWKVSAIENLLKIAWIFSNWYIRSMFSFAFNLNYSWKAGLKRGRRVHLMFHSLEWWSEMYWRHTIRILRRYSIFILHSFSLLSSQSPNESMELTTKSLLSLGQETLAVINNIVRKIILPSFLSLNQLTILSTEECQVIAWKSLRSNQHYHLQVRKRFLPYFFIIELWFWDTKDLLSEYVKFFTEAIDFCDDSVETKYIVSLEFHCLCVSFLNTEISAVVRSLPCSFRSLFRSEDEDGMDGDD